MTALLHTCLVGHNSNGFSDSLVVFWTIRQAMLPLLKRAAVKGVGMGIHRAAVINMTSLLGSVELNWGERAKDFKWYPYRTSKV